MQNFKAVLSFVFGFAIVMGVMGGLVPADTAAGAGIYPELSTITVTNLNDSGPGSLRQAVADAVGGDTIEFSVTGWLGLTSDQIIINKDLTISGPGKNDLWVDGLYTHRVFLIPAGDYDVTITDLTISGGKDVDLTLGEFDNFGAGMVNASSGEVVLEDILFYDNQAQGWGGGLYNQGTSLVLENVDFNLNLAGEGGGLCNWPQTANSSLELKGVRFDTNTAALNGGGLSDALNNIAFSIVMEDVEFYQNYVGANGGGMYTGNPTDFQMTDVSFSFNYADDGGGIYSESYAYFWMTGVSFSSNNALGDGGGLYSDGGAQFWVTNVDFTENSADATSGGGSGGGVYCNSCSFLLTNDLTFTGNTAIYLGGGLYLNASSNSLLSGVSFTGNTADQGGGLYISASSDTDLTQATFTDNLAYTDGGGLYNNGSLNQLSNVLFSVNEAYNYGGGMYTEASSHTFQNLTFAGNSAASGGGLYSMNYSQLYNTILWGNTASDEGPQIYNLNVLDIYNSDVQGCGGGVWGDAIYCGTDQGGNIDDDPIFVSNYTNLHLQLNSPAFNSGLNSFCPATDIDGVPRPLYGGCDMGAYEFAASPLFVDQDAGGAATGFTWTDAFTDLQDALTNVISGTQIWVAEGVYYPDEGIGYTNNITTTSFVLPDGVAIYGGFDPGADIDEFGERDWRAEATVLSGDIQQNDITNAQGVVTTTVNIVGANANHVVYSNGVAAGAILDGFTVTAGQANGDNPYDDGGGMFNKGGSSPTLRNLVFSGNYALGNGGGMFNYPGSPSLSDVIFINNFADYRGGGMANHNGSDGILTNVIFSGNTGDNGGGALFNRASSPSFVNVTIAGNHSNANGGGLYNWNSGAFPLTNTIVWGNTADGSGAQLYNRDDATPSFSHSDIQGSGGSADWVSSLGTDGGGNIDADPYFEDHFSDLHQPVNSPVIDAGDNSLCPAADLDGVARPIDGVCDMGAYEIDYTLLLFMPLLLN